MNKTCLWTLNGLLLAAFIAAGCDVPPSPPTIHGRVLNALAVTPGDEAELSLATALETARVNYQYRLEVLEGYYRRVGNIDKAKWARKELENLAKAQTFQWEGVPQVLPPAGESLQYADERLLVEYVVGARNDYADALENLAEFYEKQDPSSYKAKRIRNAQVRFDPVRTYAYFLEAEIPPADLKPIEVIPEADKLFEKALRLYHEGKILPGVVDYNKERRALCVFREMVRKHPRSTKIALAAYYIAEIYKEYFRENVRAVRWYERAWQWDPNVTEPARFQAGTVYDLRLRNYAKAVECYRLSLRHDPPRFRNFEFAQERIRELTEQKGVK